MKYSLLIGGGILALSFVALYVKNSIQSKQYKKISREQFITILKKLKKENYTVLKQIVMFVTQIGEQFKSLSREMIQQYLESPESPLKINELIEANLNKVCQESGLTVNDFNANMEVYKTDPEVKKIRDQFDRDFQNSIQGRLPQVTTNIPEFLTKEKCLELQNKLSKKRYLVQIDLYKRIKGKGQQQLMANPEILKGVKSPQEQLGLILQQQGLGSVEEPSLAVYQSAVNKYLTDPSFKNQFMKIQNNYAKIMNKYAAKMQRQTITETQLNDLQDEIIYFESM